MRCFIAIELPKEIKTALSKLQEQLTQSGADVKWVSPQNIHLTLKFLGEIADEKVHNVITAIADIACSQPTFSTRIVSLGAFPSIDAPRVIWVGIDKGNNETQELAAALEEKIQNFGIPKEERQFSSHITIGRIRSQKNSQKLVQLLNKLVGNLAAENLEFSVTKITLFKSTLSSQGPAYETLKEANLRAI